MMGFGLPDDNLHAPNEKFHLRTSIVASKPWRGSWKSWGSKWDALSRW